MLRKTIYTYHAGRNMRMELSTGLSENIKTIQSLLPIGESFDIITRELTFGRTAAYFVGINGLCRTEVLQEIMSDLQNPVFVQTAEIENLEAFLRAKLGYAQVSLSDDFETIVLNVLSGPVALFVDGFDRAVLIDVRTYPQRGVKEPDMERITRGARDGFVETMLFNANLIRRRIRSCGLTFSIRHVGTESSTDIAIAYMEPLVNKSLLKLINDTLAELRVTSLTMGSQSLKELLLPAKWWAPLPGIQMTERPDVACSYLLEGHIVILVDNSPTALILPCTIFQFTQSPDDYYKSPSVGGYFRLIRFLCIPVNLLLMPLFLLFTTVFRAETATWNLLTEGSVSAPRIFFYVMAVEFAIDLLKYSAALTDSRFSGSLSIVGGLLIGDIAVRLNWASPEVLFYAGITLLTGISLSTPEFADALRLYRLFLLLATGFFRLPGFCIGLLLILLSVIKTPTFGKMSYFWPLFPFERRALHNLLFRSPTAKAQPTDVWDRGVAKR